jgi:hypothetical protein
MLRNREFDAQDVDPDLHKRMNKAGAGVVKLYEFPPPHCLYVAPAESMVGTMFLLIPLFLAGIPLFLAGNTTPTIPHVYNKRKDSGFPMGCADAAALDGGRGTAAAAMSMRSTCGCGSSGAESHAWEVLRLRKLPIGSSLRTLTVRSVRQRLFSVARRIKPDRKLKCVWSMFVPVITSIDLVCTLYIPSKNQIYSPTGQHSVFLNRSDRSDLMFQ